MPRFCVATDSGCDLPMSLLRERDIVPQQLSYVMDGETVADSMLHEDCKRFYDKMRAGSIPATSQANIGEFVDFWTPLLSRGLPIVHIALGSGISGTYLNAVRARELLLQERPEARIFVVDSTLASVGYGILALKAADMRDAGATPEECVEWLETHKAEMNTYYTTSDLKYLYHSGRVSKTGMVVAHALNINPILNLDREGRLLVRHKVRGKSATIKRIHEIIGELVVAPESQTLYICHSDIPEEARTFGDELRDEFGFKDVYYTYIGPTIGTHSGPGLMAAFFFGKPRTM